MKKKYCKLLPNFSPMLFALNTEDLSSDAPMSLLAMQRSGVNSNVELGKNPSNKLAKSQISLLPQTPAAVTHANESPRKRRKDAKERQEQEECAAIISDLKFSFNSSNFSMDDNKLLVTTSSSATTDIEIQVDKKYSSTPAVSQNSGLNDICMALWSAAPLQYGEKIFSMEEAKLDLSQSAPHPSYHYSWNEVAPSKRRNSINGRIDELARSVMSPTLLSIKEMNENNEKSEILIKKASSIKETPPLFSNKAQSFHSSVYSTKGNANRISCIGIAEENEFYSNKSEITSDIMEEEILTLIKQRENGGSTSTETEDDETATSMPDDSDSPHLVLNITGKYTFFIFFI
jgi:hypothetical protein